MEFNALDALKLVDPEHDLIKVAASKEWQEARYCMFIEDLIGKMWIINYKES